MPCANRKQWEDGSWQNGTVSLANLFASLLRCGLFSDWLPDAFSYRGICERSRIVWITDVTCVSHLFVSLHMSVIWAYFDLRPIRVYCRFRAQNDSEEFRGGNEVRCGFPTVSFVGSIEQHVQRPEWWMIQLKHLIPSLTVGLFGTSHTSFDVRLAFLFEIPHCNGRKLLLADLPFLLRCQIFATNILTKLLAIALWELY